ncbi:MAG: LytTR family DNA-binding domain-containing protein [Lachnospiraceae bacterium]|nr:LytTR family DNA-binding domain-containing protein [Lachnospiraceae bacterium]
MRILICDDDVLMIEQLQKYTKSYFESNHIKCPELLSYTSGESLLADKGEKDIVFLDIEMPGMNGIYVGNELKKMNKSVIIFVVTSYSEYLDEAMRFHVFRYLSKPLDRQRFFRNMKDALSYYNTMTTKIPVETKQGVYAFPTSQIIAIEAQGRKVIVHTTQQDYNSVHNMNYWLELLPKNCFFQTHRSFIINFEHVTDFNHSTIHLTNQQITAYLTRRKYSSFKDAFLIFLESTR